MTDLTPSGIPGLFTPGQKVLVDHGLHCGGQPGQHVYTGAIVAYWRNESFTVRELECGTTCVYHYTELAPA